MASSILVKWRQDDKFYYLESTGIPTHKMMVGITEWQQQAPLPQDFTGDNAFKIPRHPVFADKPVSAKTALFSGAIAVAVNGIPIFNPIKNDGRTDTYLAGELDVFGGHCGRADARIGEVNRPGRVHRDAVYLGQNSGSGWSAVSQGGAAARDGGDERL